jgi:hypothetical protein
MFGGFSVHSVQLKRLTDLHEYTHLFCESVNSTAIQTDRPVSVRIGHLGWIEENKATPDL